MKRPLIIGLALIAGLVVADIAVAASHGGTDVIEVLSGKSWPITSTGDAGVTNVMVTAPPGGENPTLPPGMNPQPGDTVVFPPSWAKGRLPVLIPAGQPVPDDRTLWGPSPTP